MGRTEYQWGSGDVLSVQVDPAVFAANQLIGQLIDAEISPPISRALHRLQIKLEGENDHDWIEMRPSGEEGFGVCYRQETDGRRVLWVGSGFARLLGAEPIERETAITFIGELIYHVCLCADGKVQLAEKRKQEFLDHPEKVMSMLNLAT